MDTLIIATNFSDSCVNAANFYGSVFKDAEVTQKSPVVVNMDLHGQRFMLLNGGPMFTVNSSISLFVVCETSPSTKEFL